jgi:hypothetical protein
MLYINSAMRYGLNNWPTLAPTRREFLLLAGFGDYCSNSCTELKRNRLL